MRIGILTLPLHTNYGGILQAYALQTVLERMGHEVVVFDRPYKFNISFFKKLFVYPKRFLIKYILRKNVFIKWEKLANHNNLQIRKFTQPFIDEHIHRLEYSKLRKLRGQDFEAIIVGSDQIWRPKYFLNIYGAFLDFTNKWKTKRIAYAPSFGVDNWEYNEMQTEKCKKLLVQFDAVSVREKSGIVMCRKYLNHDAEWVLDPTMLLQVEDYVKLFKDSKIPHTNGTLLIYILDSNEENSAFINQIVKYTNYKPFRTNSRVEDVTASLEERVQPPVEQWLRGFYDAKFVVTDSFHACVFSILFKKKFIVLANKARGISRIESLLGYLGLEKRIVRNTSDTLNLDDIDYSDVYKRLDEMRRKSFDFLENSLRG